MSYVAPLKDMLFAMNELANLSAVNALPGCEDATPETVEAVLEENARFCSEVIAPLNKIGDQHPSTWKDGEVKTTAGFSDAFHAYGAAGWQGVQHPIEFGGQGLPKLVATPCMEMLNAANLSFALCPLLTDGAIEALMTAGSDEQKQAFLPNFIAGKWTGTMNLTEPQAGSDLAMVRSRAVPQGDGTYKISGTKIFITYGEHDMAENIVHLVLARTPNAPEGVKGISLFLVPKFLVNADGSLGARNDVHCVSIEHKLGIKASPTAVLQFGDHGGAIGTLVGQENRGLEYDVHHDERGAVCCRHAGHWRWLSARTRRLCNTRKTACSRAIWPVRPTAVSIIHQPDVRRMLMSMKSPRSRRARALAYVTAAAYRRRTSSRRCRGTPRTTRRSTNSWCRSSKAGRPRSSIDVASNGVQVHGGMGFIEETGAAQYYRDARILTIYEGTTAIQANDLIGRKTVRDGGASSAQHHVRR
jgi:alkylation response protein AidB-like acyl-CoA dehydrogenase